MSSDWWDGLWGEKGMNRFLTCFGAGFNFALTPFILTPFIFFKYPLIIF